LKNWIALKGHGFTTWRKTSLRDCFEKGHRFTGCKNLFFAIVLKGVPLHLPEENFSSRLF